MGLNGSIEGSNPSFSALRALRGPLSRATLGSPLGGVAERSNAAVSKTVTGGFVGRGFKSLPLRSTKPKPAWLSGFGLLLGRIGTDGASAPIRLDPLVRE